MAAAKPGAPARTEAGRPVRQRAGTDHLRVFFSSLGRLSRQPAGTLLSALVIGITLALPATLTLAVDNLSRLGVSWDRAVEASLFLRDGVTPDQGQQLADELGRRDDIGRAEYISKEQALAEFRERSGFGEALDVLGDNPLPAVIVLAPAADRTPAQIEALIQQLRQRPEVDQAQLDQEWLQRLHALLALAERAVRLLALMLALAVLIIVGNTIRLDIESQREEIQVMKLLGAPDSFIQRPFLYVGFWHGLFGAALALLLVHGAWLALRGPAQELAQLYGSAFALQSPSGDTVLTVLLAGIALGTFGAGWTVRRHLRRIEPV